MNVTTFLAAAFALAATVVAGMILAERMAPDRAPATLATPFTLACETPPCAESAKKAKRDDAVTAGEKC